MWMTRFLILTMAVGLVQSCAAQPGATPMPTPPFTQPVSSVPTAPPTLEPTPAAMPGPGLPQTPAQQAAVAALAKELGVEAESISILLTEEVDWPDGCLGVARPGVLCTQALVPGFRILLAVEAQVYEYRTNTNGSQGVQSPDQTSGVDRPVQAARAALARSLALDVAKITVEAAQLMTWLDGCLGVALPDLTCAAGATPGARVTLLAQGVVYEYHTNLDGSIVVPATVVLTWRRAGGVAGFCDNLVVFAAGETYYSRCNRGGLNGHLTEAELSMLAGWRTRYGALHWQSQPPAGMADGLSLDLTLAGTGGAQPPAAEQDALWAWAQAVYERLNAAP